MRQALVARFWPKVEKTDGDGCWLWIGTVNSWGYGHLRSGGKRGKMEKAHRIAWELTNGPVPDGLCVCHRCDNPRCVRPDHLFLGTNADNSADMVSKGRQAAGERLQHRPNGGRTKLTPDDVRNIRRLVAEGASQTAVGRRYGVGQPTVSSIVHHKLWSHVA